MAASNIALVIAGGELTMSLDGSHYAVSPGVTGDELLSWIPEPLREGLSIVDWTRQPSSHFTVRLTSDLVTLLSGQIVEGRQGVVVLAGTDTLDEICYLADLLWGYPQPLIFAAGKLPDGKLGSDARAVLNEALLAAGSQECWGLGPLVCAQGELFPARNLMEFTNCGRASYTGPTNEAIGEILDGKVIIWQRPHRTKTLDSSTIPARNVELIYSSLGSGERVMASLAEDAANLSGLVISGFGGGNVLPGWVPYIRTLLKADIPVVVTSRCPNGRVTTHSTFEGSFLKLHEMGALDGGDLSPLRARIKLAVGIGAGLTGEALQNYLLDR